MKDIFLLVLITLLFLETSTAFGPFLDRSTSTFSRRYTTTCSRLVKKDDDGNLFDNSNDLFKNDDGNDKSDSKLGIDIGKMLNPLTPEEAEALRAEASELISEKIAQGIDDIEALRGQFQTELELQKKERTLQSERNAQEASKRLLNKFDNLTNDLLSASKETRESTKRVAAADAANRGKGIEFGSWGTLGGGGTSVGMLKRETSSLKDDETMLVEEAPTKNRLLILADPSQDPWAKSLIPSFTKRLEQAIAGVDVQVLKPTQTMPLGGDNAACVVCFATSFSDASSLKKSLDRLLRRVMAGDGKMTVAPTHLVCVSTLGTERTNKVPYTIQNLLGGKLDKRRQMEEAVMNTVRNRVTSPPLDYTILKVGELKESKGGDFELAPGDSLDGTTSPNLAAHVLVEAVALQPFARNATLCVVGNMPNDVSPQFWNEAFLRLDGPELMRVDRGLGDVTKYDQLNEYIGEWALLMESGKKALATPIRVEASQRQTNVAREGVKERDGVRLLFLPTKTGSAYMSRSEEKVRERETTDRPGSGAPRMTRKTKEGGVEVLVEVTMEDSLRVRAKRCNMADDTVLKEMSEETILKRLEDCLEAWKKGNMAW